MTRARKTPATVNTALDFPSVADFLHFANDGQLIHDTPHNRDEYERIRTRKASGFFGLTIETDAAGIAALVNSGWAEGATRTARAAEDVHAPPVPSTKRRRTRGDMGDAIDMTRVYAGELDTAWSRMARIGKAPPRVRIVVNAADNCRATGGEMFWRGAAAVALADRLTAAGYRVELVTAIAGRWRLDDRSNPGRYCFTITTKPYHAPVDVPTLAAVAALAGFFRTAGFLANVKTCPGNIAGSLGMADTARAEDFPPDGTVTLFANGTIDSATSARNWITASIAQLQDPSTYARAA